MTNEKISPLINRLAEETSEMASDNPSHRIRMDGVPEELMPLVRAINDLADRYEDSRQEKVRQGKAEDEEEKKILAAFVSELPEGVLICDAEGQILLYNKRAQVFLKETSENRKPVPDTSPRHLVPDKKRRGQVSGKPCRGKASEIRLGCSVFEVMERSLIEYALDEINERLKRNAVNAISRFVVKVKADRVLQTQMIPILNRLGQFTGFILVFNDITRQREADNRIDSLLQSLTKSARSPLASIRSAIEAIIEYPDMEAAYLQGFREIIHKESKTLGTILNHVADAYSSLVKARHSLVPILAPELTERIRRRARDRLGILIHPDPPPEDIRVKADAYSLLMAILFVLNQLKNETGRWEFACRIRGDGKFATLDLLWDGKPMDPDSLRRWEEGVLTIEDTHSHFILKEVLDHHEADIWSHAGGDGEKPYIRFLLPASDASEDENLRPVTVLPESASIFYDLDLFHQPGQNPELDNRLLTELTYTVLIREISEATRVEELMGRHSELPRLIRSMISAGTKMQRVTWLITTFSDAMLKKLTDFAVEELGPPPVPFALIILGSEGRKEQTLKTDQDNAIIFEDVPEDSGRAEEVRTYFLSIGEKVCVSLDQAGYAFCTGEIMAKNPKWCQPLSVWKSYFHTWIHEAEPEDLLHCSIFFDFRFGCGDPALVTRLSDYLMDALAGWTGFFRNMAENALYFTPPLGLFGNFLVKSKGKHRHCLDIKSAMTPIVDFTRIYALHNHIRETHTEERLYQLHLKNILTREAYKEINQAYSFMMQLRFLRQITAIIDEDSEPDNHIHPKKLSKMEQKMLKEALKKIGRLQAKLRFEFAGASTD